MIKTFATALVVRGFRGLDGPRPDVWFGGCRRCRPSYAPARTGITGGSSVVTPPASTGVGVSGAPSGSTSQPAQPSIDINRAQQPGIGVNSGGSGNGSIKPLGR